MLVENEIKNIINKMKDHHGSVYSPVKYFDGLKTQNEVKDRYLRILKGSKSKSSNINSYRNFVTNKGYKTKPSKYTLAFKKLYPKALSLKDKSLSTGVPLGILQKVFSKGVAAWRTGHRVGVSSKEAWGYARVHSFLMLGCTFYKSDKHLFEEAIKKMKIQDIKKWISLKRLC